MNNEKWWFGFCQTLPEPPSIAIAVGLFAWYKEAKAERDRTEAWDCAVSIPYSASSKEEAEEKAKQYLST